VQGDGVDVVDEQFRMKCAEVAAKMNELGRRHEAGNDIEIVVWVIPGALACAHRPLRHHPTYGGSGASVSATAKPLLLDWVTQLRLEGVKSIISFMHARDLRCYEEIGFDEADILEFFEAHGFKVVRLPWEDPAHSRTDSRLKEAKREEMCKAALEAYDSVEKPVVLQCSAGVDRSSPAAAYIWQRRA
jgi:hypothetical protein